MLRTQNRVDKHTHTHTDRQTHRHTDQLLYIGRVDEINIKLSDLTV